MCQQQSPFVVVQPLTLTRTCPLTLTDEQKLASLEQRLNKVYIFRNRDLGVHALTGGIDEVVNGRLEEKTNQKLALLGDRLLDMHLLLQWYSTGDTREMYSIQLQKLASNRYLAQIGCDRGIDALVIRRPCGSPTIGQKAMATTVEAILGAVWEDAEAVKYGSGMLEVSKVASELGLDYEF